MHVEAVDMLLPPITDFLYVKENPDKSAVPLLTFKKMRFYEQIFKKVITHITSFGIMEDNLAHSILDSSPSFEVITFQILESILRKRGCSFGAAMIKGCCLYKSTMTFL